MEPTAAALAEVPFFKGMAWNHLELLSAQAMCVSFAADQVIFNEGEPANRFYVLTKGSVALESERENQPAQLIQTIGEGDVLGWSWLFPPHFWRFRARTLEPVEAIFFYGTRLRKECDDNPAFGYELLKRMALIMVNRLQATRRRLAEVLAEQSTSEPSAKDRESLP